jgi:hypothetical protein
MVIIVDEFALFYDAASAVKLLKYNERRLDHVEEDTAPGLF